MGASYIKITTRSIFIQTIIFHEPLREGFDANILFRTECFKNLSVCTLSWCGLELTLKMKSAFIHVSFHYWVDWLYHHYDQNTWWNNWRKDLFAHGFRGSTPGCLSPCAWAERHSCRRVWLRILIWTLGWRSTGWNKKGGAKSKDLLPSARFSFLVSKSCHILGTKPLENISYSNHSSGSRKSMYVDWHLHESEVYIKCQFCDFVVMHWLLLEFFLWIICMLAAHFLPHQPICPNLTLAFVKVPKLPIHRTHIRA